MRVLNKFNDRKENEQAHKEMKTIKNCNYRINDSFARTSAKYTEPASLLNMMSKL